MIERLTEVYRTSDGRIFGTRAEAEFHEGAARMLRAISQARADAMHDEFGRTSPHKFDRRLAEELARQGFRLGDGA